MTVPDGEEQVQSNLAAASNHHHFQEKLCGVQQWAGHPRGLTSDGEASVLQKLLLLQVQEKRVRCTKAMRCLRSVSSHHGLQQCQ